MRLPPRFAGRNDMVDTNKKAVRVMDSPLLRGVRTYRAIQTRRNIAMGRMDMVIVTVRKASLTFIDTIVLQ